MERVCLDTHIQLIHSRIGVPQGRGKIERTDNTVTDTVTVGSNPYGVAVNATTNTVYVTNFASNTVSVIAPSVLVPGVPSGVLATAGNGQATVTFTPPASDGGSAITGYTVTATDTTTPGNGGQTVSGTGSPIVVTGLTNGDSYTFTVTATNAVGTGAASAASSPATPATVPGVPTGVLATAGNGQATVTFTPPASDGGSAITGYTVTATDTTTPGNGGQTVSGTGSPIVVTGLTNGDSYTFTVTATNAVGTGAASAASSPVTPTKPVVTPVATPADPSLAATGSDLALPMGLAGLLLIAGLAVLGAARLRSHSRKPHIG
ncbi:hypothetical protein E3O67_16040 [Cryobacterium sp. TMT3-29-2]|nr:hypothetical protein E3O67_16040 [Cryobacterium sp. TMT3-29-2]